MAAFLARGGEAEATGGGAAKPRTVARALRAAVLELVLEEALHVEPIPIPPSEPLVADARLLVVEQQLRLGEELAQVRLLDDRGARRDESVLDVAALALERRIPGLRPAGGLRVVREADGHGREVDGRRVLEGHVAGLRVALGLAAHCPMRGPKV